MVEYAVIVSRNFGETFLNVWQDVSGFFSDIPVYWYVVAVIALVLFVKAFSGKKI